MRYLIVLLLLALLTSCARLPQVESQTVGQKIKVDYGPEDLVIDSLSTDKDRLIIACDPRRETELQSHGDIYAMDLETEQVTKLNRKGEPVGLVVHPHGLDLVCDGEDCYVYIVSHSDFNKDKSTNENIHPIHKYKVDGNDLLYVKSYIHALIVSPNSVAAQKDGGFFITNDNGKRDARMATILGVKNSTVVYCNAAGECNIAASKLAFANGISLKNGKAYISTTRQNTLFQYDIKGSTLTNRKALAKFKGQDNVRFYGEEILVPTHPKMLQFIKHFKSIENPSPSIIYSVNQNSGKTKAIYSDDGREISASSTGVIYKEHLYIGQVFDPFILKVPVK